MRRLMTLAVMQHDAARSRPGSYADVQLEALRADFPQWQIRFNDGRWIADRTTDDTSITVWRSSADELGKRLAVLNSSLTQIANQDPARRRRQSSAKASDS